MYKNISVSVSGIEWDFIHALITEFENVGLICQNDLAELETATKGNTGNAIPIIFRYNDFEITLKRTMSYTQATSTYSIYVSNQNGTIFTKNLPFCNGSLGTNNVAIRGVDFLVLTSDEFLDITARNYQNVFCVEIFCTKINNQPCYAYADNESTCAVNNNIVDANRGSVYKLHNALSYSHSDTGKIYVLKTKAIIDSTTLVQQTSLIDCTNVAARSIVTISGTNYYALSPNTLVEITGG